ncbi:glycosyltransferase family 2 protein [Motilimonas pumila]|uniref:Glycosyltransferase family 2 protein n=1 Tax=Motilimonas pumila TaxID=2303987 RepID=A0A418YDV0_9GAMM|nr:glycosyltransferase family 2 protein [Motilimonas pumila]RJG42712.1 glycosyltransferase family 2 protein [Motilimonas pumila]
MSISVIIPCFNAEATIKRAFESVKNNQVATTVIFVNDCSSDDSLTVVKRLMSEHEDILLINSNINHGVSRSRNLALDILPVESDFVYFLDADDWLEDGALDLLHSIAVKDHADVTLGKVRTFNGHAFKPHIYNEHFLNSSKQLTDINEFPELLLCPTLSNRLIKADLIRKLNLRFVEKRYYAEDFHFSLRLMLAASNISIISETVVNLEDLGADAKNTSLWNTSSPERAWNTLASIKDMHQFIEEGSHSHLRDVILYHSLYRLPRNLITMSSSSEWSKYCDEVRGWAAKESLINVPSSIRFNRYCKSASLVSLFLLTMVLSGKDDEAALFCKANDETKRSLLLNFFRECNLISWENGKVVSRDYFFAANEAYVDRKKNSFFQQLLQLRYFFKIKESGLFQSRYYVSLNNLKGLWAFFPLFHYLLTHKNGTCHTAKMFNDNDYLMLRQDVAESGTSPLGHFLEYGILEL